MNREQLRRLSTDAVLRLRSETRLMLMSTPEYLYPLTAAWLRNRLNVLEQELVLRDVRVAECVELADVYDPDAPLERALRPRRPPRTD